MSRQRLLGAVPDPRRSSSRSYWQTQWRKAEPKPAYDAVIVGERGTTGLGAAYYLAKEHGLTNIAVVEKGWIGGGKLPGATRRSSAPITSSMKVRRNL